MVIKISLSKLILTTALLLVLSFLCQSQNQKNYKRFLVEFIPDQGTFSFIETGNQYVFEGISSVIHTSKGSFSTSGNGYAWEKPAKHKFTDSIGAGTAIVVNGFSRKIQIGVSYHVNVYDSFPGITIEVSFTNLSSADLTVYSVEPIHATGSESGIVTTTNFTKHCSMAPCITMPVVFTRSEHLMLNLNLTEKPKVG